MPTDKTQKHAHGGSVCNVARARVPGAVAATYRPGRIHGLRVMVRIFLPNASVATSTHWVHEAGSRADGRERLTTASELTCVSGIVASSATRQQEDREGVPHLRCRLSRRASARPSSPTHPC